MRVVAAPTGARRARVEIGHDGVLTGVFRVEPTGGSIAIGGRAAIVVAAVVKAQAVADLVHDGHVAIAARGWGDEIVDTAVIGWIEPDGAYHLVGGSCLGSRPARVIGMGKADVGCGVGKFDVRRVGR